MTETQPPSKRSPLAAIFLSANESRLRAGWRLLLQTVLMFILGIPIGIAVFASAAALGLRLDNLLLSQIGELLIFTSSIFLARRLLDKRSISSLGLTLNIQMLWDILTGIGITFVMMGTIFTAMLLLGWSKFESFAWQTESTLNVITNALTFLVIFILVGWNEELLSRGYHLQTIASGSNLLWGVVLSSTVFGLLHLGNPNATPISAAGIFFAGIFIAYGYIRTKQLWLSIGLHIGWNFFEGVVFGFPVSGLDIYPLTHITVTGPELWTGGAFGPEAGLIVLPALALGAALIYLYTRPRHSS
ncbi:MAG: CPBP family intramembrane metalloprotease [Chloroflexi bacterium]|nr:CPBP family intramembrane metalloprotease [Chloroflexota bacterium]MBI3339736.1 CPBP family intramembrane metalloprotease [Chloroflexota bacterium]